MLFSKSLQKRVLKALSNSSKGYFFLELSGAENLKEINDIMPLLTEMGVIALDVSFSEQVTSNPAKLKKMLSFISYLHKTQINHLSLSCNSLYKIGLDGLEFLLASLPDTIKTVELTANGWSRLGVDAKTLVGKIQAITSITVLFEGTDKFEHQLTEVINNLTESKNQIDRNRLFQLHTNIQVAHEQHPAQLKPSFS